MMKDSVSDVGAKVGIYYEEKPWENIDLIQKENFANFLRNYPRTAYKRIIQGDFKAAKSWDEFGKVIDKY
mgnify:CR=1 FL=1